MGMRPDWPNLGVISMAYSYGFSNLVLPLLLHGIPLFLAPAPLPEILRGAAKAHWNLTVAGVPALWHAWHKAGVILSNVRLAISAGAPLPLDAGAARSSRNTASKSTTSTVPPNAAALPTMRRTRRGRTKPPWAGRLKASRLRSNGTGC